MIPDFSQFKLAVIQREIESNLADRTLTEIFTMQGILNALVYSAALNDEVITRSPDRALHYDFRHIGYFFRGDRTVKTPVTFLSDYLKKFWAGVARYSRDAVRKTRLLISGTFKVFTQEDRTEDWRNPLNRHRNPNPCGDFNMLRALLLARACEERLLCYGRELEATELNIETAGNGNYEWERVEDKSFPQHKGYTLAAIGKAAGIWRDGDTPHPDIVGAIELEYLRVCAEQQFEEIDAGDRTEEEILEQEFVAVTEMSTVESDGVATVVERVVDAVPLAVLVRRSMLVPARRLLPKVCDGGVSVPSWAVEECDRARAWWIAKIQSAGLWLLDVAPSWALAG